MRLMKSNFIITFIYILFLLIASIFVFNFGYKNNYPDFKAMPMAKQGVLDLSEYDFNGTDLIKIRGEAEFYYNQLLSPRDFENANSMSLSGYQNIHGVWNNFELNGMPIGGKGLATYRLKIKVPDNQLYGLKIKEFDCAYNIWINGFGPVSAGKVAYQKKDYVPNWKRNEIYITARNNELDLVLQIANFSHRKGGPEDVMILGKGRDVLKYKSTQIAVSYLLFGILAIMAVYHLVLFFYRPKDRSILYFSLLNFSMSLRLLTTGEKVFMDLFPNISWLAAIRLEYISYTIAVPIFLIFIYSFYPNELKRIYIKIINWVAGIFVAIVLLLPSYIFSYSPLVYQGVVIISALYILYVLIMAMIRKREHAFVLFGGYFFFFLIIINDLMYYNKVMNTSFIMPLGVFVLVFSQAFVLSKKTSKAYTDVEKLSSTLDKYTKELEDMVDDRVREIRQQKEEIEEQKETLINQAEELKQINNKLVDLDKFKENMTHMVVHDLKNPLNVILNITNDRIIKLAGKQMLNLVQNILDVQKYHESRMELCLEPNSITTLIQDAIDQVYVLLEKKQVKLENNVATSGKFDFDKSVIARVIINLLTNAITYVPVKGKICINYRIEGNNLILEIYNDGPNIPDEEKDFIFSKYGHEKGSNSFFNVSTGLGLTFCKMALDAHKGKIGYFNHNEVGVTFWVSLPVKNADAGSFDQNISFLKSRKQNVQVDPDLSNVLSVSDKLYLNKIKADLNDLEIFEISKYKTVLKEVNRSYSVGVYVWIESVNKALQSIDEKRLQKLLDLLN